MNRLHRHKVSICNTGTVRSTIVFIARPRDTSLAPGQLRHALVSSQYVFSD